MNKPELEESFEIYKNFSEDELYALLVPNTVVGTLDGRVSAGKEALSILIQRSRISICHFYQTNKELMKDSSDFVKALAEYLSTVIGVKLPIVPVALLLCKLGLAAICKQTSATQSSRSHSDQ